MRTLSVRIPSDVARKIGHYVYLYVDPRTRRPFYVGKGRGVPGPRPSWNDQAVPKGGDPS